MTTEMAREEPFFPIKLTAHDIYNYEQWRSSCRLYFQKKNCSGILDGTESCPPESSDPAGFQSWNERDQEGLNLLKTTISDGFLKQLGMGSNSSPKLWLNVQNHFATLPHPNIYRIKSLLHNVKKDSTMSIIDYLTTIKGLADQLGASGAHLEDHDIVYAHILTGLPEEYESVRRQVMSQPFPVRSGLVVGSLLEMEKQHKATRSLPPPSAPPAHHVAHNSDQRPSLPVAAEIVAVNPHHQPSPPPHIQEDAEPAIGIDLGTTYSRVAVWHKDHVEIIRNDHGNRKTASYVAFTDADETLVGDAAFNQVVRNTANTIFDIKRLIGRRFSDNSVQNDVEHWPFKVIEGAGDKPMIVVTHNGQEIQYNAENISSMILSKMRKTAETFLGSTVKNAVITVPAFFDDVQRRATINAGAMAGLNVLGIINEPSAAAISYGIHKKADWSSPRNVMIFDLGGGTLDVSLLTMTSSGEFQVKATVGNTHLGGEDFDNRMVEYCIEEFKKGHGLDISKQFRALRRLKKECEKVKKRLSFESDYDIEVDCLYENKDFTLNFTREKFEQINLDLFEKCMEPVNKCLKDLKMDITSVDDVILAGGSSRIPKVQELLQEVFKGKELCKGINPDEGVVYGAAAQAALLSGNGKGRFIQDFNLKDVTAFGICVEGTDEDYSKKVINLIRRNSLIPVHGKIEFSTVVDNQDHIQFHIYEGEKERLESLNLLGECNIVDIPPARRLVPKFDTFFKIDANGILSVFTLDKSTRQKNIITINGQTTEGRNDNMAE